MKTQLLLTALLLIGSHSWAKEEAKLSTEKREVHDFQKIMFTGKGNLYVQQGDQESVRILASEDLMPYIKTEVSDGTLHIGEKGMGWFHSFKSFEPYNVYVTAKKIEEINFAGKGMLTSEKEVEGKSLALNVSGSGKVDFALKVENLSVAIAGSGEYNLKGRANTQEIHISGTATYNAMKLLTQRTSIDVRGFGDVNVNAQDKLDVTISGKANVIYMGKPAITQKIHGTGKIEEFK